MTSVWAYVLHICNTYLYTYVIFVQVYACFILFLACYEYVDKIGAKNKQDTNDLVNDKWLLD